MYGSPATARRLAMFKHFPSKEALIFVRDPAIESGFVRAVGERAAGTSILEALPAYLM
jgi:hypothetical protein